MTQIKLLKEERKEVKVKGMKINISAYAHDNGISWITAKKRLSGNTKRKKRESKIYSKLEPFKEVIDFKIENYNCSAVSIFFLIKSKGYEGSLSLVSKYVSEKKKSYLKIATIRVESTPGLQGQVDWKESMTLYSKKQEEYTVNIFLFILSYSKYKYIELTIDRRQDTLFSCLINCFKYLDGVPEEIWFDNMKTVVNSHDINTNKVEFNQKFLQLSKNLMFIPIACKPYRPCTKGIVENLAKIMNRLRVYNNEFDDYDELKEIVNKLNNQLNHEEISQATNEYPYILYEKEKEYLTKVNFDQYNYDSNRQVRKVSQESMINYNGHKYSVPVNYLGSLVEIEPKNNELYIYYNGQIIRKHKISNLRLNYEKNDLTQIIKTNYPKRTDNQIEDMVNRRLEGFDLLLRKKDK